ncbi:hypothetical protein DL546_007203 [Coniochaeta pulveracea]|uniref:Uncharacterized protein n=1 Tax=Coniochaeta pulveracea TaxID=177199 RepID=A0A420YA93_9PEZI|nr:hypothetical protein DL546_007203 [Coniochaeta pulveracea]
MTEDDLARIVASGGRVGWIDGASYRGTWDIVWLCVATTFICTYTLLCLNIPAPKDSTWTLIKRRSLWMVLAILGPEIVLTFAAGQWSRARHSVAAFQEAGYSQWNMRMAFFADMGGFVLRPLDGGAFPLNAKQLHWLVTNGHIDYPNLKPADVWDRSKQDRLAKAITAFQVAYIVLECIGRACQNVAITTLELNTLGIVVCSLMTSFAWLHKPSDVRLPVTIDLPVRIGEITGDRPWKTTPLDFVDENGPGWSINVQPFVGMPVIPPERPIQRIPNDRFPMNPYGVQEYCVCLATLLFAGIHVAGWNFSFPTRVEQILWRSASLILFGVTAAFWILETVASWVRLGRWKWLYLRVADPKRLPQFEKYREEKLSVVRTPTELPLPWEFWSIMPVALLYGISRLYLISEAFLELRSVDATAFVDISWTDYLPHI